MSGASDSSLNTSSSSKTETRRKIEDQIMKALSQGDSKNYINFKLANDIEVQLFHLYLHLGKEHRMRLQSLCTALKENVALRKKVVSGEVTTHNFVNMNVEDLANDTTKKYRQERDRKFEASKIRKEEVEERKLKKTVGGIVEIEYS